VRFTQSATCSIVPLTQSTGCSIVRFAQDRGRSKLRFAHSNKTSKLRSAQCLGCSKPRFAHSTTSKKARFTEGACLDDSVMLKREQDSGRSPLRSPFRARGVEHRHEFVYSKDQNGLNPRGKGLRNKGTPKSRNTYFVRKFTEIQ